MQTASLIVAICGLVLASLSLSWQAANFVLTGGRVRVKLYVGAIGNAGLVKGKLSLMSDAWLADLAAQGFPQPVIVVEAANVGRLPVTVQRWGLVSAEASLYPLTESMGPNLPHRLEVGQGEVWYTDLAHAVKFAKAVREVLQEQPAEPGMRSLFGSIAASRRLRGIAGVVELGDGRSRRSRETFE